MASNDEARAPIAGGNPAPQSITATLASTAAQAITGAGDGPALYEFVAAGFAHVAFGVGAGMTDAATTDRLITSTPVRLMIDPTKATHIKAIRNGADNVIVSFQRVR
jgi:hypothetical protein